MALRMKETRQRCQVAPQYQGHGGLEALEGVGNDELDATQAAEGEAILEIGPKSLGLQGPDFMPSTSRPPSPSTPTATVTATEAIRQASHLYLEQVALKPIRKSASPTRA